MALPTALNDREYRKFEEVGGEPAVRVTGQNFSGTFSPTGLNIAGRMTLVTLNDSTWTALPATPLANRNAISIQNQDTVEIKYNYDNTEPGYVGAKIAPDGERFLEIKDTIIVYAKTQTGTATILVEELS